jgi:hypothetical protein
LLRPGLAGAYSASLEHECSLDKKIDDIMDIIDNRGVLWAAPTVDSDRTVRHRPSARQPIPAVVVKLHDFRGRLNCRVPGPVTNPIDRRRATVRMTETVGIRTGIGTAATCEVVALMC